MIALAFEKPLMEVEARLADLRHLAQSGDLNITEEIAGLEKKAAKLLENIYSHLSPWQKVLVARHANRPHTSDYITALTEDFTPLCGDRTFGEDSAIMAGLGRFRGLPVMVMGHEKGRDTEGRVRHNFGMPRPEGYRKAYRLLEMAGRFGCPVITFVDTPGAHPGADAEERGQSEAIAKCLEVSFSIDVPVVTTVIGEGGSGGAVALAVANTLLMLENAIYSAISPEGCASILWRTRDRREDAALAQKMTAADLLAFRVIDRVIQEPLGGAHRNHTATIKAVGDALEKAFIPLLKKSGKDLREERRGKFLNMGRRIK